MSNISGAILGVDFGLKWVGLAVCDNRQTIAVGAGWLEDISGRSLARRIRIEAEERLAKTILIGQPPIGARNSERVVAGANILAESLRKMGFEVIRWDESYTTAAVLTDRKRIGGKSSKPKGWLDEAAAILILQGYIDNRFGDK
ncbi:MAG: RuvX/YqgF family protein [Candidatus Hatepunaea meridiana]|nr:RuvX/YqgF family protein [Candidatus Hatepunaea meridiana]